MKDPRDLLPVLSGAVFSLLGLAFAWWSYASFMKMEYGNALIAAGGAIAFCTLPMARLTRRDLHKSLNQLAADAVRTPEPLPLRVAIGIAWLLIIAGFISFFL